METLSYERDAHPVRLEYLSAGRASDEWPDRWFVTNGVVAIGPVSFETMLRGVAAGQIPRGSLVRHESWTAWRGLKDIGALPLDGHARDVEDLKTLSSRLDLPAGVTKRGEHAPTSTRLPRSLRRPAADGKGELQHALLLTLSTAVRAARAELGLVYRVEAGSEEAVCIGGHDAKMHALLGERLTANDPTLRAARCGHSIVGEPEFGENSRHLLRRFGRCASDVRGVAMVPLLVYGDLLALFELGSTTRPFRAREIASAEEIVEGLAGRSLDWI